MEQQHFPALPILGAIRWSGRGWRLGLWAGVAGGYGVVWTAGRGGRGRVISECEHISPILYENTKGVLCEGSSEVSPVVPMGVVWEEREEDRLVSQVILMSALKGVQRGITRLS